MSPFFLHYFLISTYGRRALQYSITSSNTTSPNGFLQKSPNDYSKSPTTISPSNFLQISKIAERFFLQNDSPKSPTHFFTEDHLISVLLSTEHVSSNTPTYLAKCFLQTVGNDPVSDPSLHVPRAPRSALWVVGYGSLVMPVPATRARAPRSMLWTKG